MSEVAEEVGVGPRSAMSSSKRGGASFPFFISERPFLVGDRRESLDEGEGPQHDRDGKSEHERSLTGYRGSNIKRLI